MVKFGEKVGEKMVMIDGVGVIGFGCDWVVLDIGSMGG